MAYWTQRNQQIDDILDVRQRTNTYYQEIEACEYRLQAPPFAAAAKNSYNHVVDTLLSNDVEVPLDWQKNLTISFDESGIPVKTRFGFRIRICAQDESGFITDGFIDRETSETLLMMILAEYTDCFFDVGANVGYFSLMICTMGQNDIRCYAFEPRKPVFERLAASIMDNGYRDRIAAMHCAVGDNAGQATMKLNRQGSGGNTLCQQFGNPKDDSGVVECVDVITLDSFIDQKKIKPRCAVLKIDVEGYESNVIDGASGFFGSERAPIVLIETFPRKIFGESHDRHVLNRLKRFGYNVYAIRPFRPGQTSLAPAYRLGHLKRSGSGNYLAFPNSQHMIEQLCRQPLHTRMLLSSERLQRILDFQESSIVAAETYFRDLANGKDGCVFRRCQDIGPKNN